MKTVIIFAATTRLTDAHHSVRTDAGGEIFIRAVETNDSEAAALTGKLARELRGEVILNAINFTTTTRVR